MFFQLRVVALIRGILISLDADVHARMVWRPYAMAALRAAGERIPAWALEQEQEIESGGDVDGAVVALAGGTQPEKRPRRAALGAAAEQREAGWVADREVSRECGSGRRDAS